MNAFTTPDVKNDQSEDCRTGRQQRSAESLIHAVINHLSRQSRALASDFTDAVEHHDRIVQGVTDDREERSNFCEADLEVFDQEELQWAYKPVADRHDTQSDHYVV